MGFGKRIFGNNDFSIVFGSAKVSLTRENWVSGKEQKNNRKSLCSLRDGVRAILGAPRRPGTPCVSFRSPLLNRHENPKKLETFVREKDVFFSIR